MYTVPRMARGAPTITPQYQPHHFCRPDRSPAARHSVRAAYAVFPTNSDARDSRVIKAVLMNSAGQTQGWNNGQSFIRTALACGDDSRPG